MAGKGRAEHGGGAAKWRHGWIPVNAAARAIVAARAATKTGPHVKPPRLRPTEEDSSVVDETTQTLLRSPDVASGTPSLFRGRRNIVDSAPPPFLGKMAHIQGPHSAEDDSVNANPGYYSTSDKVMGSAERYMMKRHQINCYNCVQAWELRRRGYAVQAQPAQEMWKGVGQSDGQIAAGWRDGEAGPPTVFSLMKSDMVVPSIQKMPPGSRVFIVNQWKKTGTGHVFTAEKGPDGTVHFYDPQTGAEVSSDDYFSRAEPDVAILRVDNLTPRESVSNAVEPSTQTTPGTWRASLQKATPNATSVLVSGVPHPDQGPSFPKIVGPHDWKTDLTKVNPNYDHASPMVPSNRPWITNCVSAVTAFDMRMRGYDVQAVPCPDGLGWQYKRFTSQYRHADGSPVEALAHSVNEVLSEPESWPDGAWGVTDTNRHIFMIMKQGNEVVYLDPQSGSVIQRGHALSNYWSGLRYSYSQRDRLLLRMDDLQPVANADWLVQGGGTNGGDVRAGASGGPDTSGPQVAA